jgi:putative transposase
MFMMFTLFEHRLQPTFDARLQFLEAQIRFLRARLDTNRILPTPEEKLELLRLGEVLQHDVDNVIHIVQPKTYRAWRRKLQCRERFQRSGRSRISDALRNLILRIRQDNTWVTAESAGN